MTPVDSEPESPQPDGAGRSPDAVARDWMVRLRWDFVVTCLAFGLLFGVGLLLVPRWGWSAGRAEYLGVILIFGWSHFLASGFQYFPSGAENGLVRLGLAAFCRTFAPLLALISIHNYIFQLLNEANVGSIVAAYLLSFALTLAAAIRSPS